MADYFPSATAEYSQAGNSTNFKIVAIVATVLFLFYAIKTHLVTEFYIAIMSLCFDKFTIHATSYISDLILLIMLSCTVMGAYFIARYHTVILMVIALLGIAVATMGV